MLREDFRELLSTLVESNKTKIEENIETISSPETTRMSRHRLEGETIALRRVVRELEYILETDKEC